MQITTWKPDLSEKRANNMSVFPYEWAIKVDFTDGGFMECKDLFPFLAPESGYVKEFYKKFHPVDGGKETRVTKVFYFHVGNPPQYGLMKIRTAGRGKSVFLEYLLNTKPNDRNLETGSQGDVTDFR